MVINKFIKDSLEERGKSIEYVSNRTGYTLERLDDIVNCKSSVMPVEAENILNTIGITLGNVIYSI